MELTVGSERISARRVFCIGRNYVEHAHEMGDGVPTQPVVFQKPPTRLVADGQPIPFPSHGKDLHYEAEVVVLIGREGRAEGEEDAERFVKGVSLGVDLTLRDVQRELKGKGLPWELAKAFDHSAPVGTFVPYREPLDLENIPFSCRVNGEPRQEGNTRDMVFPITRLVVEISRIWYLLPGDLIYTGTPSGVGSLQRGAQVTVESGVIGSFSWWIT